MNRIHPWLEAWGDHNSGAHGHGAAGEQEQERTLAYALARRAWNKYY